MKKFLSVLAIVVIAAPAAFAQCPTCATRSRAAVPFSPSINLASSNFSGFPFSNSSRVIQSFSTNEQINIPLNIRRDFDIVERQSVDTSALLLALLALNGNQRQSLNFNSLNFDRGQVLNFSRGGGQQLNFSRGGCGQSLNFNSGGGRRTVFRSRQGPFAGRTVLRSR